MTTRGETGATTVSGRRPRHAFFVGMAIAAAVVVLIAFVPEYRRNAAGTFPIAGIVHVHAAIMVAWVAAFGLQAYLGATGRTACHRRAGWYAVALGWLAWASMIVVEFRGYAVHPLARTARDLDWDLPGPIIYATFAVFLGWATQERRRPAWHKRLMTFALFLSLAAALERFEWIPMTFGFVPFAALLDLLLLGPMIVYDRRTSNGRLHRATVAGATVLLASQALLVGLWGTPLWHRLAGFVTSAAHG